MQSKLNHPKEIISSYRPPKKDRMAMKRRPHDLDYFRNYSPTRNMIYRGVFGFILQSSISGSMDPDGLETALEKIYLNIGIS